MTIETSSDQDLEKITKIWLHDQFLVKTKN